MAINMLSRLSQYAAPASQPVRTPRAVRPVEVATMNVNKEDRPVAVEKTATGSSPDREALLRAARIVLNAVSEAVFLSLSPAASQPDSLASSVSLSELIRHFLSDDERAILKVLAGAPAGHRITASWVQSQTEIGKSDFWVVWSGLQVRGLIRETGAGRKPGYVLAVDWVRLLLN